MANAILYGSKDQLMAAYVEGCLKATIHSKLWQSSEDYKNVGLQVRADRDEGTIEGETPDTC